jgi:hypothetical protein
MQRIDGVIFDAWRWCHTGYPKYRDKGQRFGQAFLNEFFPDVVDPEVFHDKSLKEVLRLIEERYVDRS